MRHFISDTHFGHERIIELCGRPFSDISHMDEMLIKNWNDTVAPEDTIFHLGDVALGPWDRWDSILTRLNGYKILVVGNHDRVFKGGSTKNQERFGPKYAGWFDEVHDNLRGVWLDDGTIVDLSHFPYDGDSHGEERYRDFRLHDGGRILIHGHTHAEFDKHGEAARVSRSKRGTVQIHVGVDAHGYSPVSEDEVIRLIQSAQA